MKARVLLLLVVFTSLNCFAQEKESRFGFELDGGASLALKKLDDAKMKIGLGFEGTFHYRFYKHMGVYAGWGWNNFSSKKSFIGNNCDFEETGYVLGLQFKHPIGNSPVSYYVRAGGLWNHIEIENNDGDIIKDTKHGLGYQLAGGVYIPVGRKWSINTGIKFNSLKRGNIEFADHNKTLDLKYLSLRVGIMKMF
ncbi:porin family protein [Dysgonomonas sp. Marseille-P4677]|uniref:porin family protein n=1 Tax=Dysgonomonas sp. Marseille-P4677 TaxID=2364790 RepID=UPI001913D5BD|nr:porin family protein [Dysgonomonas sp. Marseille-P4677]MBK5721466.1 porin family protein [Dysgonomonas sp. Marseille-P4677]